MGAALRRALAAHDVVVVGGGNAAVAAISADPSFDLVLCDVMMPDLSGPRVFELIRASHPDLCARFVFITGGVIHRSQPPLPHGAAEPHPAQALRSDDRPRSGAQRRDRLSRSSVRRFWTSRSCKSLPRARPLR